MPIYIHKYIFFFPLLSLFDWWIDGFITLCVQMDRHKYVKVAFHGFEEMSKEDKVETYGNILVRNSFDGPDYAVIDTLFSLSEAFLFAQLVDFKDKNRGKIPENTE